MKKDYDDLEKDADKVADLCNQLCDDVDKLEVISDKRRRISVNGEQRDIPTSKLGCTKIYNAKDIVEAGRIVELLKEHGIAAFSQEAGASVSMHGASGFGMYGMDVLVETDEVKRALQIIEAADDSQGSEKF